MSFRSASGVSAKRWMASMVACAVAIVFAGCNSQPKVLPSSGPRPPTSADQVKIYQTAPSEYEIIGEVYAPIGGKVKWDDQGDANEGFEHLRADAAAVGANGLLLAAPNGATDLTVLAGYRGMMYKVPIRTNPKAAVCEAIWVVKE